MNRNAPCPCGSGKRFKHCCGVAPVRAPRARDDALAAHRSGALGRAETLYRRALHEQPDDIDSLHMLGVVQLQRLRYREALELVWDAAERTGWSRAEIRHNVGLVLGKLVTRDANIRQADLLADFVAREQALRTSRVDVSPLVSVVLPAYNHARYVAQAIASVAAQTYPHIELIVIDDGSTDRTAAVISECVAGAGFPVRCIARENRGAPATLNEGAALAKGRYLAFLNSDDHYAPERIATLVDEIARVGVAWGFSLVSGAGAEAGPNAPAVAGIDILQRQRNFLGTQPNSFTLVEYNIAISTGNLFVERDFFFRVGGFREYRYNHDWDFCLRASAFAEPVVVDRPLYFYRRHESNTIGESRDRATEDADRVLRDFLATVLSGTAPFTNDLGPHAPANRAVLLKLAFRAGQGALVPIPVLRSLAAQWRAAPAPRRAGEHESAPHDALRKTALVVLGMHRSGTSAMSRVLNLCGAFLPEKLKPPKIGVNPKGFWEPEAVLELNARVMRQMGGEWDRVDFPLQTSGDVAEEFDSDARALLASEYEGRATIVIKDPRMCVLAPLWHRALVSSGYRPVYVVPIRHPLEVARSLHARGDMTVDAGLTLWSAYMKRVLEFTDGLPDVLYVRFGELLDDWRGVVARIAARSDVRLDAGERATEIDRFLEHGLKRQSADENALDAAAADPSLAEIGLRYRSCLARCHRDASELRAVPVATHAPVAGPPGPVDSSTVGFVLCIENNPIRHQALLLCESIRRFGGRYSGSPILAFAPRPGMGVDRATRRALEGMDVEYVDQPLNTTCLEYAPANRVFAGAWAEAHTASDFLVVLDSDTLWFDEPQLPQDADAAVRPVDVKGSATRGPGDRFEDYWARLAQLAGTSLDRLPRLRSTIGNEHIRASYNAGLTVVRRGKGILTRCADLFSASLAAGMRPYRGSGMNIFASTGHVGQEGSEYWGSSQAAMTLAIWATTDRVIHYPDHYNVPLHLIAAHGEIDPRWLSRPPVHLHYHWMFAPRQHEVAMELLAKLGLSDDRQAWVRRRTPLADHEQESSRDAIAAR